MAFAYSLTKGEKSKPKKYVTYPYNEGRKSCSLKVTRGEQ